MDIFKKTGIDLGSIGKKAVTDASASIFKKNKKLGDAKKMVDALGENDYKIAAKLLMGKKASRKASNAVEKLRR